MGHLGHLKQEYRDLVERLDKGSVTMPEPEDEKTRAAWREILELLYTPEDAAIAARMPVTPQSLDRLAQRLGTAPDALRPRLDAMCDKGLVMDVRSPSTGKIRYLLAPPVVGFFEFSLMRRGDAVLQKRISEAMQAYTHGDDGFAREVFGGETAIGRALVHESALGDPLPDVLDWERATSIAANATTRAVSICYCRHKAEHLGQSCDAPQEICLSLDAGAEFVVRRGFGRAIEKTEMLEILSQARELGLVQLADNVQNRPAWICNCCPCCCGQLEGVREYGLAAVNPSGFEPRHDESKCAGCSKCARACPAGAIAMEPRAVAAKRRATLMPDFDLERCIGCGVCADVCHKDALVMERGNRRRPVPSSAVDRTLRMALERGRLAEFMFETGEKRGGRFLAHALRAIVSLPGAQRALASRQLKSRFVEFAIRGVKDPTA